MTAVPRHALRSTSPGPPPDATQLRAAALDYLARYAATEAGLRRILERRIDRWARRAASEGLVEAIADQVAAARAIASQVVVAIVASGVVDDAAYAETRGKSLLRAGRSRRATAAQLAAKGVDAATAQAALPDDPATELAAALVLARKRRIGPFRPGDVADLADHRRELAILARAGFPQDVARRALATDPETAEAMVNELRR